MPGKSLAGGGQEAPGRQSGTLRLEIPFAPCGNRGSIASRVSAMVRAMTRLRNHFRLAGTTYQGACGVEQRVSASANAAW